MTKRILLVLLAVSITLNADARGGGSSGGGGGARSTPSFSGGRSSSFSGGRSTPSFSGGKSTGFSSPSKSPSFGGSPKSTPSVSGGTKPTTQSVTAGMGRAAHIESSRVAFKGTSGKTITINKTSPSVTHVTKVVTPERAATRTSRTTVFYQQYGYSSPPVVTHHYHDSFNPWFYMWLMDKCSADDRARWAYNHRSEIDPARLEEMKKKDANLEARIKQLESSKTTTDPTYVPVAMKEQPDLMYSDDFVRAVAQKDSGEEKGAWGTIFKILLIGLCIGIGVTIIFGIFAYLSEE